MTFSLPSSIVCGLAETSSAPGTVALAAGVFPAYALLDWIDIGLALAACLVLWALCLFFFRKKAAVLFFTLSFAILAAAILFNLANLALVMVGLVVVVGMMALFFNMGSIREAFQNPASSRQGKMAEKAAGEDIPPYDEKKFFCDVTTAVLKLAATKTGAIMTFEKKMPLDSFMQNGTIINAPFTPELVETIFYVGTRLHDGAIIVRKNIIVAASVYYTPSTKALTGKFGARHRAALGISEATDSVTVVCSEETGRISIAYNGRLEPVRRDEFPVVFREYMKA